MTIDKAFHLGKKSSKPRLLKNKLSSVQEKAAALRNKLKLRSTNKPPNISNIFITPDYTPLEQKRIKLYTNNLLI